MAGKEYIEGTTSKTYVSKKNKTLRVSADNSFYDPYDIPLSDIIQILSYTIGIFSKDYKFLMPDYAHLKGMIKSCTYYALWLGISAGGIKIRNLSTC